MLFCDFFGLIEQRGIDILDCMRIEILCPAADEVGIHVNAVCCRVGGKTAGFIRKGEGGMLCVVLLGNIFGCLCAAMLSRVSPMDIQGAAQNILELRLKTGAWRCGLLGIGCGFMMTTSVKFAREKNYLPLLFAVPLFIVCGFTEILVTPCFLSTSNFALVILSARPASTVYSASADKSILFFTASMTCVSCPAESVVGVPPPM